MAIGGVPDFDDFVFAGRDQKLAIGTERRIVNRRGVIGGKGLLAGCRVITSYSIHYTKLYEKSKRSMRRGWVKWLAVERTAPATIRCSRKLASQGVRVRVMAPPPSAD